MKIKKTGFTIALREMTFLRAELLLISFFILVPYAFLATQTQGFPYVHSVLMFDPVKEVLARSLTLILFSWLIFSFFLLKKEIIKTHLYLLMIVILIWQGISLTWSLNPYQGREHWIHWISLFAFFFVCLNLTSSKNIIPRIMTASLITATSICWISIICAYFNVDLPFYKRRIEFPYAATFGNPKFAAEFIAPLLFWGGGLLVRDWNIKKHKYFYLFCIGSCLFTLLFIYKSRASLVGLAIPIAIFSVYYFKKVQSILNSRKVKLALLIALGAMLLVFLFLPYIQTIFNFSFGSNAQRVVIWLGTLKLIKDYFWIGVGMGNFNLIYPKYISISDRYVLVENHFARQAHNEYLQIFSELGIIGLLLTLGLIFFVCRSVFNHLKNKNNEQILTLSLFLSWITHLVIGFFVFNFQNPVTSFYMMATLGFLIRHVSCTETFSISHSRWLKPMGAIAMIGIMIIAPKFLIRSFLVKFYQLKGQSYADIHSFQAIDTFKKALTWEDNEWETHFMIAKAYEDYSLFPQAIDHLTSSLKLNPYYENSHYNLGLYYEGNKQTAEAIAVYQKLLQWMPDYRKANLRLAQIAYHKKNIPVAEEYLKKVLTPTPHQQGRELVSSAFLGLALCEIHKGNHPKARHYMNEAFLFYPKNITENPKVFGYWLAK